MYSGITRIVLPRKNEPDLEDLPNEVRKMIEVFPVDSTGEVLALMEPRGDVLRVVVGFTGS